ncbi:MAG: carbamoyl-phosphate synthase large subunit [Bdellovibrionota bacterium]
MRDPKIKKVLILGSGPIVIGQACEFDYSGTQACKALMKEGLEVVLINSNPATIMTDPEIATKVYIEPLKAQFIERIIEKEKPDSLIPTLGGQTALNAALELDRLGILEKHNVKMLGTSSEIIQKAEDREKFKHVLDKVGAKAPKSYLVRSFDEGWERGQELGFPIILRPNYTLGGAGGGIAYSIDEYRGMLQMALYESPTTEVLIEQSILGWKEFELEVMRDRDGTFVVICSIENFDPCGIHTGDSITVAPQQTLTDKEYQDMRDEAQKILNEIGLETGGANVQFAVDPKTKERVVIEMNPRVSRSSALASKATGFPIAKIAALLSIGYRLNEITNDITKSTPCCYEPALDYVVTKIPRFAFEKFPGTEDVLTTQMKSVGEVMGIGRTFKESFQKALHSLENDGIGFKTVTFSEQKIAYPNSERIHYIAQAFREGKTTEYIHELSQIDYWFLEQFKEIMDHEQVLTGVQLDKDVLLEAKRKGFSDKQIAVIKNVSEASIRELREQYNLHPCFFQVDTCAAEFQSETPYYYSTYWSEPSEKQSKKDTIVVIGSGPNRIGQGIEFDYGCVRGVKAIQKEGLRVVMINSNPETVSTDYDTSNELYFEPLTYEFVHEVMRFIGPKGFIPQWGGQTSIGLAHKLVDGGYELLGSSLQTIDLAEDRGQFSKVCRELNLKIPKSKMIFTVDEAKQFVKEINYPVLCRPSYVIGGRRMEVLETDEDLEEYFDKYGEFISAENPFMVDEFLERALEVDVDLVRGLDWCVIGGVVEHIEAAGVHSGDSMGVLPPQRLKDETLIKMEELSKALADKMNVIGHLNLQLAVKNDEIYVLEANPRSSRSVPFVAKASMVPLVDLAVKAILGKKPEKQYDWKKTKEVSVKGVVFPFNKFKQSDSILGPEMKSTGESMGRGADYSEALLKAFISSHVKLPQSGEVFLSLREKDKEIMLPLAKELLGMGYTISATRGTAHFLGDHDLPCVIVRKVFEGRPNCVDRIRTGKVSFVINTTSGRKAIEDSFSIRRSCIDYAIPCVTESDAAEALLLAIKKARTGEFDVKPL